MVCATRSIRTMVEASPVLAIEELSVTYTTPDGEIAAVRDVSLTVRTGECVGVVGESGAGKSQAFLAVMGLLPPQACVRGRARFGSTDLLGRSARDLNRLRGARVAMIFQNPLTSLTPHMRVGDQIAESMVRHSEVSWRAARARALQLLERVHVTDPRRRLTQYPHELSGGMRQRVMIAIALACEPQLVIADEPTTALDVTIQAQIIALLAELKRERGMAMVLITHDLGIVAGVADRVAVMQAGRIVEAGGVRQILKAPHHAYTQSLLSAVPRIEGAGEVRAVSAVPVDSAAIDSGAQSSTPLLAISALRVQFTTRGRWLGRGLPVRAVDGIDLALRPGETLGVVGESGSGKSTLARAILQLVRPVAGEVVWLGQPLQGLSPAQLRPLRRDLQLVFQDPLASLDPRMTVAELIGEPLRVHRRAMSAADRSEAAAEILLRVGLHADMLNRYPHELSGGQCQRVAIARAMVLKPKLLVCDEAVSALDVSVQAQILGLLQDLERDYGTAILFISHNLAVVRQLCTRVLVLYLGRMMELAPVQRLFESAAHPYTRGLLESIPLPDPDVQPGRLSRALAGELPSAVAPPSGCVFRTRCPHAIELCRERVPVWEDTGDHHCVACHRWREIRAKPTVR